MEHEHAANGVTEAKGFEKIGGDGIAQVWLKEPGAGPECIKGQKIEWERIGPAGTKLTQWLVVTMLDEGVTMIPADNVACIQSGVGDDSKKERMLDKFDVEPNEYADRIKRSTIDEKRTDWADVIGGETKLSADEMALQMICDELCKIEKCEVSS